MSTSAVDPHEVGRQWIRRMSWTSRRALTARARRPDEAARFTDVGFRAAMRDPMAQIARIYRSAGIDLTDEARAAMSAWRAADAREKLVKHTYTAERFGLSAEQIRSEFADYIERFVPPEERG
jgi:hypothetical protein